MLKLPTNSFSTIQTFLKENEILVYRYMVLSISNAIKLKKDKTELFSFGQQNEHIAMVRRRDYEKVLVDAIGHFSNAEEYEQAAFTRDLLQRWKIEQLINEKPTE